MRATIYPSFRNVKWLKNPVLAQVLQPWLIDNSSLTARLKAHYKDFAVRPIRQQYAKAFRDEFRIIGLRTNQHALIREVFLFGNNQPVVFAHSVLPRASLRGAWSGLVRLGNKPLGATLFANPKVKRSPLEYKKLSPYHPISIRVAAHMQIAPKQLWARRSVFSLNCAKILVTEVFLPKLLE